MAAEGQHGGFRVAGERVLEGVEVYVLKCREEIILEGSVVVMTFVVLSTLFGVLVEEQLLVEGVCPCWDYVCVIGVGWADEWVLGDEGVLSSRKDNTEVAVLAPAAGTLDQRCVCG